MASTSLDKEVLSQIENLNINHDSPLLISDADEIPNFEMLNKIKLKNFALFRQKNFLYKLNLMSDENWLGTGICYKKYLQSQKSADHEL